MSETIFFRLLLFIFVLAFIVAKLEINIEGKDGWAKNLPTWRIKNKLTDFFLNKSPLTGYHLWLFTMIIFLLHFPFFMGVSWNVNIELVISAFFFLFLIIEDFLWFIINPDFGIKKFNPKNISWHKRWVGPIPANYIIGIILTITFLSLGLVF